LGESLAWTVLVLHVTWEQNRNMVPQLRSAKTWQKGVNLQSG